MTIGALLVVAALAASIVLRVGPFAATQPDVAVAVGSPTPGWTATGVATRTPAAVPTRGTPETRPTTAPPIDDDTVTAVESLLQQADLIEEGVAVDREGVTTTPRSVAFVANGGRWVAERTWSGRRSVRRIVDKRVIFGHEDRASDFLEAWAGEVIEPSIYTRSAGAYIGYEDMGYAGTVTDPATGEELSAFHYLFRTGNVVGSVQIHVAANGDHDAATRMASDVARKGAARTQEVLSEDEPSPAAAATGRGKEGVGSGRPS